MITRRLVEHTKEVARFAPVRPAVKAGLRAAIAAIVPVLVASTLKLPGGLWLSVGGFNAAFLDKGGSYRTRATGMAASGLAGALSVVVGGLAGHHPVLAIPLTLLWVTGCSFARVYGAAATTVGNTAAVGFVISLALPAASLSAALTRGGFLILGCLWAMLLSLVLWPLRPYRPARFAVARCFRTVAEQAEEVGRLSSGADSAAWQALIQREHARMRETLEETREVLAATRRGRHGESGRGERLLVLLQAADAMFGTLIALGDAMESLSHGGRPIQAEVASTLSAFSRSLQELARLVETEGPARQLPTLEWGDAALREALSRAEAEGVAAGPGAVAHAQALHAARHLAQLRDFMNIAVETAATLHDDRPVPDERRPPWRVAPEPKPSWLTPLRENFSLGSVVLRHALRVGVTTAVAVWLATGIRSHGYWATVTVLTVMQPYTGSTFLKGLQRVVGTVVGGVLAAAVAAWLHDPHALIPLVFVTAGLSIALMPLNYGLYTIFVTLTFVLLAEMESGDWSLAGVRILNTLIGGALALAGSWLLWERPEKELLPEQLATALRADREYFQQVISAYLAGRADADPALSEARRKMGLAAINAEASFQRLLSEPRRRTEPLEPLMTLLAYTRRFAASVISLSTRHERVTDAVRLRLERFASTVEQGLDDIADAVARGKAPAPLPDLGGLLGHPSEDALLHAQLERVARQLTVLHEAATRRVSPGSTWSAGSEAHGG